MPMDFVVQKFDRAQMAQIVLVISRVSSGKILKLEHLTTMG